MNKKLIYILAVFLLIFIVGIGLFLSSKNKSTQPQQAGQIENQQIIDENQSAINQQSTSQPEIATKTLETNQENSQIQTRTEEKFYTMEEVAKHNSRESCWTVIQGEVYDLTQWINKHPGGADKILALCGKDGTQSFEKKHGGQEKPEKALEQFEIGKLKQ